MMLKKPKRRKGYVSRVNRHLPKRIIADMCDENGVSLMKANAKIEALLKVVGRLQEEIDELKASK